MSNIGNVVQAVVNGDVEEAKALAARVLEAGDDLEVLIKELSEGMSEVGRKFESFEIFLPEMIVASEAMMAAIDVVRPKLQEQGLEEQKGKIVLGAPAGDMHEIGKDIVKTVLGSNGYEIVDLGPDINALEFIKVAEKENADIIAISTLMTTTMPGAAEVIQLLQDKGLGDRFKVIVGGAPTNNEWAEEAGFDGWAPNAFQALNLVNNLMGK